MWGNFRQEYKIALNYLTFMLEYMYITMMNIRKTTIVLEFNINGICYTSQIQYVFRLEENVSRVVAQNSLTP